MTEPAEGELERMLAELVPGCLVTTDGEIRIPADRVEALLAAVRARLKEDEDRTERHEEALRRIDEWSRAYPLKVFPEPDFKKARSLLEAGGMTIDAISASNMRHVVEGVGEIARAALHPKDRGG